MSRKNRLAKLEQAAQPGVGYEICMNLSVADFAIWAGEEGLDAYLQLLELAGLLWLGDNEKIVNWMIDIGDGERFESQPPVVRRVRYTPPRGWPKTPMIKVWDVSSRGGRPGKHVRELEQPPGDPWPSHWPAPRLPLAVNDQEAGNGSDR